MGLTLQALSTAILTALPDPAFLAAPQMLI
jgi:hypothetical protein